MAISRIGKLRLWAGAAALTLGLALAARDLIPRLYPGPDASAASPLQSADAAIRLMDRQGPVLAVYADVMGAQDQAGNLDKAGEIVRATGQALRRGVSDDLDGVRTLRFVFRCEAVNRFGQELMAPLVTLDVPLGALKGFDDARARPGDLLALAERVGMGAPGSYDAVSAWCADPARRNGAFCAKTPAGAGPA